MKNLFKNLMLVAVAAMAFTACEKDIVNGGEEQNAEARSFKFYATFADDTRSGFVGSETNDGKTFYKSAWDGDEEALFYLLDTTEGYRDTTTATIENETFEVDFSTSYAKNGVLEAYSPASAWTPGFGYDLEYGAGYDYIYTYYTKSSYSLPKTQEPRDNSVDPKAHILKAVVGYQNGKVVSNTLEFEHQVAYGKLSLKNFAGTDVTSYVLDINGDKYVINSENTTDVWFACEPVVVENMTLSVVASEGTFTKTLVENGDKNLKFVKGRVSTFAVDMTDATIGEAEVVFDPTYTATNISWNGSYFNMTGIAGLSYVRLYLHANAHPGNNSIVPGDYVGNSSISAENQFNCRISDGFNVIYPGNFTSTSTLEVSFKNNEYIILITHNGVSYGYKGMPDGWVAPEGGR